MTAIPLRLRAVVLAALFAAPGLSGCLLTEVPALFGDPPVTPGPAGEAPPPDPVDPPTELPRVNWTLGDTWIWQSEAGVRLTDQVVGVREVQRQIGTTVRNVTRYDVESRVEVARDLPAVITRHTYEPDTLGVTNSTSGSVSVQYMRADGGLWRNTPLLHIGPSSYTTSFTYVRDTGNATYHRVTDITNEGRVNVTLPIGTFEAWHVKHHTTTKQERALSPVVRASEHWFSPEVRNDVQFTRGDTLFRLLAYRVGDDDRDVILPQLPAHEGGWQPGWRWVYQGGDNIEVVRYIASCDARFDACRGQFVWDPVRERDLLAYGTITSHIGSGINQYEIDLLPRGSSRAESASFTYGRPHEAYRVHYAYTPGALPLVPSPGHHEYIAKGERYDGRVLNHTVLADVTVGPAFTFDGPYGPTEVVPVWENLTYKPRDQKVPAFEEKFFRLWSDAYWNDVTFEHTFVNDYKVTFHLESVQFVSGGKPERDV